MVWLSIQAKLKKEKEICDIRNRLYDELDAYYYYNKHSPHITLVPPFWVNGSKESFSSQIGEVIDSYDFEGKCVDIRGLDVWEDIDKPDHVILDVDTCIGEERKEIVESVKDTDAVAVNKPVPYHITLFSNAGWWDEPAIKLKAGLERKLDEFDESVKTEIDYVKPVRLT